MLALYENNTQHEHSLSSLSSLHPVISIKVTFPYDTKNKPLSSSRRRLII